MSTRALAEPTLLAVFPPADGPTNFAHDDALLHAARSSGGERIRVYTWDRPVVSFGRNERVMGRYDAEKLSAARLGVVRRPTGGRALLHSRELTFAFAGPAVPGESLRATYDRISAVIADALGLLGVRAERAGPSAGAIAEGAPCFTAPSAGELTASGRKLVASAQWREADAYLQHGSILIDDDQSLLADVLTDGATMPPLPQPATLRALLGRVPTLVEFADALMRATALHSGNNPARVEPHDIVDAGFVASRRAHYADPHWTWRR